MPESPEIVVRPERLRGRVQRIAIDHATGRRKGFGFIRTPDGADYFFHACDLIGIGLGKVHEGDDVMFTPTESAKGLKAIEVTVGTTRHTA